MIPHRVPFFLPLLYPTLTWRIPSEEKELFITFDDGPVAGPTEFALDQLERRSAHATFFCIGDNIAKAPAIFSAILAGGHTIGNHTVNHINGWKSTAENYLNNTTEFDGIAARAGLTEATDLFRPPYGRITKKQIALLKGYRIVMWDVLSQDYDRNLSPERCLRKTIAACRKGSIIVFHDSYKAQKNMEFVLPRLLDHFSGLGYRFRAIPSLVTRRGSTEVA